MCSTSGCLSEQYSVPFPQDLPLLGYLTEHNDLVGRQWLMEQLEQELFTSNRTGGNINGVILAAELGYGKSAFITSLLCPKSQEHTSLLHKHIVAFHVCKFDIRSTHSSERFIRRLVGFFTMKSAEYGNIISMMPESTILYDRDSCDKEPEACFDQGITIPLKQLKGVPDTPWVVVIDALDECEHSGNNPVLDLLSSRIKHFPKWLKLLVTSRNMTALSRLKKLNINYLLSDDSRNVDDVKLYIQKSFPMSSNHQKIDNLVDKSEGSFVYIIQAIKWIVDTGGIDTDIEFPRDLGDIYEINFDRQFEEGNTFEVPKKILEIVCSTLNPVTKNDIFTILKSNNVSSEFSEFNEHFNSLAFFLRPERVVRVSHQALYYWLINENSGNYHVSLHTGHALISKFLFNSLKGDNTNDLVDLSIHVANSNDTTLSNMFMSSTLFDSVGAKREPLLHKLIWKTSCVKALELLFFHCSDANAVNEGNVTPAFVASAKGHIDQLKFLHRKGADLQFTVKGNILIHPYDVFTKLEMMKRHYYSGYSLLHIAAQHGHIPIVRYILGYNNTLVHAKNALGLHAGHVACENGHLHMVEELYKLDSKLSKYRCLFYAAKNNHKNILKWVMQHGVEYKCISDKQSVKALNAIENVSVDKLFRFSPIYFAVDKLSPTHLIKLVMNPLDDWWRVFKMDPLNIALRSGSVEAAKYLIEEFPTALDCVDAFGYTAALVAVQHNLTKLLPLVKHKLSSDKCVKMPDHLLYSGIVRDSNLYRTNICPEGGSFAHIVAMHELNEIMFYSIKERLPINWNEPDNFGHFPIHYAMASRNIMFMILFKEYEYSIIDTVALNGSTPYHIAAMSSNVYSLYYLTDDLKIPIPNINDSNGRGVMHYIVLRESHDMIDKGEMDLQVHFVNIFSFLVESWKHDVLACDNYGRNVLHYALRYGHVRIVKYLVAYNRTVFNSLIRKRDIKQLNPVAFALLEYKRNNQGMVPPLRCPFYDVFYTYCMNTTEYPNVMSSWELGLVFIIQTFSASEYRYFIEPNLNHILKKSPYVMSAIFVYQTDIDVDHLRLQLIINTDRNQPDNMFKWSTIAIARHKPSALHVCEKSLLKSPLHYILLNTDHKDTMFSLHHNDVRNIMHLIYHDPINRTLFSCPDNKGYNIFHYSLIGGNIQTARILMQFNIRLTSHRITLKDVFLMAMSSRQRSDPQNFIECSENSYYRNQEACTDLILNEIFKRNRENVKLYDFCKNESMELSLVHLLSANGMVHTLKSVVNVFGLNILNCQNRDGFTPLYLAKLFNKANVVSFISDTVELVLPDTVAEEWLIWSMLNKFPQTNISDPLFCLVWPTRQNCKMSNQMKIDDNLTLHNIILEIPQINISNPIFCFAHSVKSRQACEKIVNAQHCINRIVNNYFIDRMSIMVSVALSKSLSLLNSCINSLGYIYVNYHSNTCQSCEKAISECYTIFQYLYIYLSPYVMILTNDSWHMSQYSNTQQKLNLTRQQFSKLVSGEVLCNNNILKIHKLQLNQLIISVEKVYYVFHRFLSHSAIRNYLQGGKTKSISVPESYTYLHTRMNFLKFPVNRGFSVEVAPLVAVNSSNVFGYRHLNIVKQTLAYKYLKERFTTGYFSHAKISHKKGASFDMLKEPFRDLE